MRNNLTGIELVTFAGESVLGEFKFGKFRHDHHSSKGVEEERESAILEFDMKEKHLKDCDRKYQNLIQVYIFQTQIFLTRLYLFLDSIFIIMNIHYNEYCFTSLRKLSFSKSFP